MIPITKPSFDNNELEHVKKVLKSQCLTDGVYLRKTEELIKKIIKSKFVSLTHSCTAALEISAILINLKKNDEVIMPSYGFSSVPNAIVLRGAKPIFTEIDPKNLNITLNDIKKKITKKTKAIYVIHYAGNSCEIEKISKFAKRKKIYLIEDAAHAFMAKYKKKYLGTYGDIGVFSFHETKNLVAGQAGCISINNSKFIKRCNYILDKGTNRRQFLSNMKNKIIKSNNKGYYSWVDVGSEYRSPELSSALVYSQITKVKKIYNKRKIIWNKYDKLIDNLKSNNFYLVKPIKNSLSSYHILALIFHNLKKANQFRNFMQRKGVAATFHYVPLHKSKMGKKFCNYNLPITENIFKKVVRLPLFSDMTKSEFNKISKTIITFENNLI